MIRSALAASAVCLSLFAVSAQAADLAVIVDDVAVVDAGFDWEGLYVGANVTGEWPVAGDGESDGYYGGGVVVGYNFLASEGFLIGIEGAADAVSDESTYASVALLGRLGALVTPDVLIYGIGGLGYEANVDTLDDGFAIYELGAGLEFAVTDSVSLRGQVIGFGYFEENDDLFEYAKASVGVSFYF